jgi:hypothetical protein
VPAAISLEKDFDLVPSSQVEVGFRGS